MGDLKLWLHPPKTLPFGIDDRSRKRKWGKNPELRSEVILGKGWRRKMFSCKGH